MHENLTPPANLGPTQVQKTWFFERGDGYIFACDEKEAWNLLNNRSNWMRKDFKMLGVSNGGTYVKLLSESQHEIDTLTREVQELKFQEKRVLEAEDKLRFEEFLPDDDPKLERACTLRKKIQADLLEKESRLTNINQELVKKAFDAELEQARGNLEAPRNFDITTPVEADRHKIISYLK